jgi:hypothetical protein
MHSSFLLSASSVSCHFNEAPLCGGVPVPSENNSDPTSPAAADQCAPTTMESREPQFADVFRKSSAPYSARFEKL